MAITGEIGGTPVKHGFALSDHVGAQSAFSAAMTAICNREITGDGQLVDISTMQALVWMNSSIDRVNADIYSSREGNHHLTLSPYGVFSGKNMQSIIICALNPKIWNSICNLIGKPELSGDPRFASVSKRASNRMLVVHEIEEWLNKFDNIQGAIDLFENAGVPCCRVLGVNEVLQDTHIRAAGWLREIEAPDSLKDKGVETYLGYAASVTFSETPAIIGKAADLGQHNHEIFGSYGISSHETDILNDKWKKSAFSARR
jgi:crotonobetainyl-CoA:carnitine CoA-transferase CaiB-like acyl-CoA transferase